MTTNSIHKPAFEQIRNQSACFLSWWWRGLTSVWTFRETPKQFIKQTAQGLEILEHHADSPRVLALDNPSELTSLTGTANCYLLAPTDRVIHTKVPDKQRDQSLTNITESLLPFKSDELHVASNVGVQDIFAIARSDIDPNVSYLRSLGLTIEGIAFVHDSEFHCQPFGVNDLPDEPSNSQNLTARLAALASFVVVAVLAIIIGYSWQSERQLQARLSTTLSELEVQASNVVGKQPDTINSIAASQTLIAPWQAGQALSTLDALLQAMLPETELSQIILSNNELLIDGNAPSAIAMQTKLDESALFTNSEFVAAISSDPNSKTERFRLRSSLGNAK